MRAVRPDDDAVALACGSGGAHRRNRALAGTEERASAKFSAASSCGLSNILVQIENRTPDRPNFEPRRYNSCTVSIARRGRREFSPLATARPLKRLKTAMGALVRVRARRRILLGSAPHDLGGGAATLRESAPLLLWVQTAPAAGFREASARLSGIQCNMRRIRGIAILGASCKIIWNASHNPSQNEAMYLESIRRLSRQYSKIFRFTVRNISV